MGSGCTGGSNSWFARSFSLYDNVNRGMVSSFTFLRTSRPELYETAREAELKVNIAPLRLIPQESFLPLLL